MRHLILLILLLFNFVSKAQYTSPLDSIPQSKKELLLKFGENMSTELLAEKSLKLFRKAFDSLQTKTKPDYYLIPNMGADSTRYKAVKVPITIINSLNKKEFSEHLLAIYADTLSEDQLTKLNKTFKTEDGIRYKEFMCKVLNDEYSEEDLMTISLFDDIENYNTMYMMSGVLRYISENIMQIWFSYIVEKSYIYE